MLLPLPPLLDLSLVKSFSGGCRLIDLVVAYGFVMGGRLGGEGGDIEWVVFGGGHEGWVGCFCLSRKTHTHIEREREREREREMSHGE